MILAPSGKYGQVAVGAGRKAVRISRIKARQKYQTPGNLIYTSLLPKLPTQVENILSGENLGNMTVPYLNSTLWKTFFPCRIKPSGNLGLITLHRGHGFFIQI